jgi:DNA (cytosine-5)-methyltransferase 1
MRVIELFAGVGGFRLGLESTGHKVVWANEFDHNAADTYDKNFGGEIDRRDITAVPTGDIPDHDIIVGGFPCQAFSRAGGRKGFDEIRGTLFFDVARIAKEKRTPYLLLENVEGLLSHDNGRTIKTILSTLNELGYDTESMVVDSFYFNAGRRKRVFVFAAHREYKAGVLQGAEQAASLYARICKRAGLEDNEGGEVGRGSGRIIRASNELSARVDDWEAFYGKEAAHG